MFQNRHRIPHESHAQPSTAQNRMSPYIMYIVIILCALSFGGHCGQTVIEAKTTKSFEDVVTDVEYAIIEYNFRITSRSHVGAAIRERGYPGFPSYEIIHFCNLTYAKEVLEIDPGFVKHMPCRITIREEEGNVIISSSLLPENSDDPRLNVFSRNINTMLRGIVDFAVE